MKTILTLLIASMFIIGCGLKSNLHNPVITSKEIENYQLMICKYGYAIGDYNINFFIDSCNKYSVGDTLIFKK